MDAHGSEYLAAVDGMAEVYGGTDAAPLAEGMAVEGNGWWGTVEWIDDDRVMVCTEPRHAWIAYSRSEVRRAAR
jgi:hypothetical protein